ncbi:tyrosine-type recombinase/integrase [Pseudoduganella sp. FT93W]|uniref:Tyrosine-type recombinase/integrase n=1 Tax=Duganella fentianensis TaxID=2692177 RepID=A0A845I5W6_9BURK|nr:tyrosine-type recombinase/integrase [Duganella fentianensis]MYN47635.1 tyrosine-type recombinase/integrase [Duganella fentianensis]
MNELIDTVNTLPSPLMAPMAHGLGPVADDWEAAEVWLRAIASRGRRNSPETVATYRYHIAKLRWFCENVHGVPPSRWTVQDVEAFYGFLADLPDSALCAQDEVTGAYAGVDDEGYSPFRKQPSASSRSDIQRCIHAMFRVWREMGYIAINPMGLHGAGTTRKINANRAVVPDLYDLVLDTMEASEKATFAARQAYTRDRFIFIALRELGLRASELIKATMGAFHCLTDPKDGKTYWVMVVREETAKGRRERTIPVTKTVMAALGAYREAFGMDALPAPLETGALILSPRTDRGAIVIGGKPIRDVESRRFFQAWLPVTTRHGLYYIVKGRLTRTADALKQAGDVTGCAHLRQASPHWPRHTFAKSALLTGQDVRQVAALLGHRDLATTMVYTEQDALDLIRATNMATPGLLAEQVTVSPA